MRDLERQRGAFCDICEKSMNPFEYITLKGNITVKGDKYPNVSSDFYYKVISKTHLCKECFDDVMNYINKSKKKGK